MSRFEKQLYSSKDNIKNRKNATRRATQKRYQNLSPAEKALSRPYDRLKDLPPLIPLWPAELTDFSQGGTAFVLAKINQYLRAERRRSIKSHWSYNLNKHAALLVAYHHELRCLKSSRSDNAQPVSKGRKSSE